MNRISAHIVLLLALLFTGPAAAIDLTPKIGLRLGAGMLSNHGTAGGSGFSTGALNAVGAIYTTPDFGVYAGYSMQFDVKQGTLPLKGLFVGARYHFIGEATRVKREQSSITSTTRSRWSLYGAGEIAQRSYFTQVLDSKGQLTSLEGSSLAINVALGAELRISDHLDINAELNNSLLTFAATDPRYRISGMLLYLGIGLLF